MAAAGGASTTGTTSVAAIASAARSARSGPRPPAGGVADQTARPGLESMPDTVVTRPSSAGSSRSRRPSAPRDCRTKWLNGPPAKAMPPVSVGVPVGVEPERALLHPYGGGEARVDLGQARARAAAGPDGVLGGAAEHPHGRPRLQAAPRRQRDRLRAVQRHVGEEPAVGRDAGLRAPARPSRSAAPTPGRRSTGWRASGCRDRRAGGCAAPAWRCPPRRVARGRRPRGCAPATALKRAHSAAISSRWSLRREVLGGGQRVLNERVLLHRRQHDAGRHARPGPRSRAAG